MAWESLDTTTGVLNVTQVNHALAMNRLLRDVRGCEICRQCLPLPPKPILSVGIKTRVLIIGQAPGLKVHEAGIPWQDKSGETLCSWLGISREQFLDTQIFGTMPMGFCYPGTKPGGGDLPPRPECAPAWHEKLLALMPELQLTLLIGRFAIKKYLMSNENLTETVRSFDIHRSAFFPLVHPSPLNFRWHAKNPWFESDVVPVLKQRVRETIG
jgi:uracil-DNA glycosylase